MASIGSQQRRQRFKKKKKAHGKVAFTTKMRGTQSKRSRLIQLISKSELEMIIGI
jgi:hypothetical protein